MLFAQIESIPGLKEALDKAGHDSYEAILVVIILVVFVSSMLWMGKWFVKSMDERLKQANLRETELRAEVSELKKFQQETLTGMIREVAAALAANTTAMQSLVSALDKRMCFWDAQRQDQVIDQIAGKLKEA